MSVQWNDTDRQPPQFSANSLPQFQFVCCEPQKDWSGNETWSPQ